MSNPICLRIVTYLSVFTVWSSAVASPLASTPPVASIDTLYGKLPLRFEENRGQTGRDAKYLVRGFSHTLFFTSQGVVIKVPPSGLDRIRTRDRHSTALGTTDTASQKDTILRLDFEGGQPEVAVTGQEPLDGHVNYFHGSNPSQWQSSVPTYRKLHYREVYPGIDVTLYGNERRVEYDFVVAPHADPAQIRLRIAGADALSVDAPGSLEMRRGKQVLPMRKPVVYQTLGAKRKAIEGKFVLKDRNHVGFLLANYDTAQPLTIDPVVEYATFLGGRGVDIGYAIAVDRSGQAYVTGYTSSVDFPAVGGRQSLSAGLSEAFVTKINAAGTDFVYSTYLGGNSYDEGHGIAVDSGGNAYITGSTSSTNFPLSNPIQGTLSNRSQDAFVAKLSANGTQLIYATYLGGTATDSGNAIAVDALGSAYVTGGTVSTGTQGSFPVKNPILEAPGTNSDAFVTKLSPTGTSFVYSSRLGGTGDDWGTGIAVDASGNAYISGVFSPFVAGQTFPVRNALQPTRGGSQDAFVTKINRAGSALVYSTYLGGSAQDQAFGIAIDSVGSAYVTGWTGSPNFPVRNPIFAHRPGWFDGFLAKVNTAGNGLVYSTFLSPTNVGSRLDAHAVAVNASGTAYVTGTIANGGLPLVAPVQPLGTGSDAFVMRINPSGSALSYSTYFGGGDGKGIAVDSGGRVYLTGINWNARTFPATGTIQPIHAPVYAYDAFIARLSQ